MGRKVKIADLKKFDVFKTDSCDLQYIVFNDGFCCTWNQAYQFQIATFAKEVELLGRMEFKKESDEDINLEIAKIMRTGQ